MADYSSTASVDAPASRLFDYLSDISNLPKYFAAMTSAEPGEGNTVRTTAEVNGHAEQGEAWFEVDPDALALRWGSEGPNDYHGQLTVTGDESSSSVEVTVSTDRAAGPQIQDGVDETVATVKRLIEGSDS